MKKNDIIDFVLDNGTPTLIRALEFLGNTDNIELLDIETPHSEILKVIEKGKVPFFNKDEALIYSLYSYPPIMQTLQNFIAEYRITEDDLILKQMWHWMLYGMEGEKVFGTAFFSDFFYEIPNIPKYPFSKELLKSLPFNVGTPKYLLI